MAITKEPTSPNVDIDAAIKEQMKKLKGDEVPPDVAVKIIATAITWEKVKHHILNNGTKPFDPDDI